MARVAVLGEQVAVEGYALVGALVRQAESDAEVQAAWESLPEDVEVVILTSRAAGLLGDRPATTPRRLTVVMPQ